MLAVFLDFDGVIVDSLDELYFVGVLAFYGTKKKMHYYEHRKLYKQNRHVIYSEKDEYCLLKALDLGDFGSFQRIREKVKAKEIEAYSEKFKNIRNFYQSERKDRWCNLHKLTTYGEDLVTHKNFENHFILTRKSVEDVCILKNHFKIPIPDSSVFGRTHSEMYGDKIGFIENYISENSRYKRGILLDDMIKNFRKSSNVDCYFAPWGFGNEDNTVSAKSYSQATLSNGIKFWEV